MVYPISDGRYRATCDMLDTAAKFMNMKAFVDVKRQKEPRTDLNEEMPSTDAQTDD
jgi:hypothetical protein